MIDMINIICHELNKCNDIELKVKLKKLYIDFLNNLSKPYYIKNNERTEIINNDNDEYKKYIEILNNIKI